MTTVEWLIFIIATIGTLFMLVSAIGILRLPGVHASMHAVGKASTVGITSILLAAGIFYGGSWFWLMAFLAALFFVTSPISTTALARAAFRALPQTKRFLVYNDMDNPEYRQDDPLSLQEQLADSADA